MGFLANLFGNTVKKAVEQETKRISKEDPEKGGLLKRAAQVQKDADEYYDSLTQKEKDDWDVYMKNKYGSKD